MEYFQMMPKSPRLFHLKRVKQVLFLFLNNFSKIYEKVIKDQLASGFDKYFSPFISSYRKGYSTQYMLTCLVKESRKELENS